MVKRSGQRVNFNVTKIAIAIKNAFDSVYDEYAEVKINKVFENVLKYIEIEYKERKTINVEDIQDIIEKVLKEEKYEDVYESFNKYRIRRAASRKVFSMKEQHKFVKAVEKIALTVKEENSSKPQDIICKFGKIISTEFSKAYLLDAKYTRPHEEGNIFIYDIADLTIGSFYSSNLNLSYIEPDESYFDNLINELKLCKLEVSHEVSLSRIDYLFSRYFVYKFKKEFIANLVKFLKLNGLLEYINVKKIEFILEKEKDTSFNIGIFESCINNDVVRHIFEEAYETSLLETKENMNFNIRKLLKNLDNECYTFSLGTSTTYEGRIISKIYFDSLSEFKNINTIFKVRPGINLNSNDINYDLLKKSIDLVKMGINILFSFLDNNSKKDEEEIEYFASGERIYENKSSQKNETVGRLIVSKTSIDLPRIALNNAEASLKSFYEELDEVMNLVKNQLLLTFEIQSKKTKENYNSLFNNNLIDIEKFETNNKVRKIIKNGTLNIDVIGLKECSYLLSKKEKDEESEISKNILSRLNKLCEDFSNEHKLNFVLSITNDKKVSRKLLAIDKTVYGVVENVTDKDNYEMPDLSENNIKVCQNYLNGGCLLDFKITPKDSFQKLYDYIKSSNDKGIRLLRLGRKNRHDC
ncbi:hypothetical protein EOM09_03410 [bacterium]|nr:hypothetical protein [bacterium]